MILNTLQKNWATEDTYFLTKLTSSGYEIIGVVKERYFFNSMFLVQSSLQGYDEGGISLFHHSRK